MANGKPGGPDHGEDVTAEVTLSRTEVGYSAHIAYRNGESKNIHFDLTNLQGAKGAVTHHMTELGYLGVSHSWRAGTREGTVTRLFRREP